jgi:hypothetical protein
VAGELRFRVLCASRVSAILGLDKENTNTTLIGVRRTQGRVSDFRKSFTATGVAGFPGVNEAEKMDVDHWLSRVS